MPLTEGLEGDIASLSKVLPVLEGSGSATTTIIVPMLRRLYDAAIEGRDLQRLMDALQEDDEFAVMERLSDRAGLTWACPLSSGWRNGAGEPCEQCGKTKAEAAIIAKAAETWKVSVDRLVDLVDGPRDEDGWPATRVESEPQTLLPVKLTEGEHWAIQDVDTMLADAKDPDGDFATVMGGSYTDKVREDLVRDSADRAFGESSPKNPDPRCKECGERLGDSDRAEVYINADTLRANAGGQDVLVDDIPEEAFGPYLVHADPCSRAEDGGRSKYALA